MRWVALAVLCLMWAAHIESAWGKSCEANLSPRVLAIQRMLTTYREEHGIESINRQVAVGDFKGLCARSYVKNYQFDLGCNLAGNHYGSLASAFAAAVVLNRTLVVQGDRAIQTSCEGSVFLRSWTVTQTVLEAALEKARCNIFKDDADSKPAVTDYVEYKDWGFTRRCGYARSTAECLKYDDLFNSAYELLLPSNNEFLNPEQIRRSSVLFSNPTPGMARFESYGFLLRALMGFTNQTVAVAKNALEGLHLGGHVHECLGTLQLQEDQYYTIGLHIRHKIVAPEFERFYDEASERAIRTFKERHERRVREARPNSTRTDPPAKQNCVLLVASDRAATLTHLVSFSAKVNCTLRFIQRDLNGKVSEHQKQDGYEENGPWSAPSISMADWFLLTHADYFVGSAASTFSFLIAGEVAARAALHPHDQRLSSVPPDESPLSPFLWTSPAVSWAPGPLNVSQVWTSGQEAGFVVMEQQNYLRQRAYHDCPLPPLP